MLYGYGILNNHVPTLKATVMRGGAALSPFLTSLYAVYKGESNANDSLGTYNGTAQGGLTFTTGKSGNAFTFNGTTACIDLPTNSFNSLTGDFTINTWLYLGSTPSFTQQYIFTNYDYVSLNAYGFLFYIDVSTVNFSICNGTPIFTTLQAGGSTLSANTWYMITITRQASTGTTIYVNGVSSVSNSSAINPVYNSTQYSNIGCFKRTGATGVNSPILNGGKVDELNVWNKKLTTTEITTLYNSGAGKFYPTY
jgi:hypothetical protein